MTAPCAEAWVMERRTPLRQAQGRPSSAALAPGTRASGSPHASNFGFQIADCRFRTREGAR